jgi:2-polyprenyl-3-methyl-5-hydroxy-6-metoxy-1,4-benzoquinol methylase
VEIKKINKSEKFWNKRSKEYDRNEKKYEQDYNKLIENMKTYLEINDIVLDYGCGTGIITNEIADNVKEIHAIDISYEMIVVARRKAKKLEIKNVNYSQSTIFDENYGRESYNVISAFNILHLLEDCSAVIKKVNELLKPGGLFISSTACMGEKRTFIGILLFLLTKIKIIQFTRFFKFSELETLIANEKFQIVKTEDLKKTPPAYFVVAKKL